MTPEATKFIAPITFQGVTGRPAYSDMWDAPSDISGAARRAGPPRRADGHRSGHARRSMARLALGLAEDLVSLTALATRAPMIVCPAMDANMWEHPATQAPRGHAAGRAASRSSARKKGASPPARWAAAACPKSTRSWARPQGTSWASSGDLAGKKIVVSAGGTQETIDPVRFIGNESSGKMGFAVAEAARDRGARRHPRRPARSLSPTPTACASSASAAPPRCATSSSRSARTPTP